MPTTTTGRIPFTTLQKKVLIALASAVGLRMLGLFLVLPVFTLAFVYGAPIFKMLRSQMEIALTSDFTIYAEALGLRPRTVLGPPSSRRARRSSSSAPW